MKAPLLNNKATQKNRSPWKLPLLAITLSAFLAGTAGCDQEPRKSAPAKRPAITVGKKTYTAKDFQSELERMLPTGNEEIEQEEGLPHEIEGLRKNLVKQIIEEHLILQEAERLGFTISKEEVEEDMNSLWDDPTDEDFKAAILEKYASIDNWKAEIKKKLTIKKIVEELVNSKVEVSATEAKKYYNEHRASYTIPAQVRARMIVVETKQAARAAKKKLAHKSFEVVAASVSIGLEASKGGDLGFFGMGDMPPEFEEVVFNLSEGKVSNVVKTPYGYHIFKVEERRRGGTQNFTEVKNDIVKMLKREKFERAYQGWIVSLKKNTKIEINEDQLWIKEDR